MTLRTLFITLLFFTLTRCAIFSKAREQNLRQVQVGESEAEVVEALGQPSEKSPLGSGERWYYEIISMDEKSVYPYTGVFENGKLISWYFDTPRVNRPGGAQNGPPH